MMGASSPAPKAAARNVALSSSRAGRPKLTLETPSVQCTPSSWRQRVTARKISVTCAWLVEAVMTRQSMRMRSRLMP